MAWHEITLGDAIRVRHGFAFKSQHFSDSGDFVVLTPGNFNVTGGFRLRPGKDRFYTGEIPEDYVLNEGDLIVAMTEQGPGLLGSSAFVPEDGKYLHNQRLGLIQYLDSTALDKRFLYYLLNTRQVRAQISGSATGTKVRHTAPERICRVTVSVPIDVDQQRHLASILSAYDNLIQNNHRRLQLLEQAAQLIYQEWFVHLCFPGYQHGKFQAGVPHGWERQPLAQLCTDTRVAVNPKDVPPDTAYIGLDHIPRRSITLYNWGTAREVNSDKWGFSNGDILIGRIRPYLHKVGFALVDGIASSDTIVVRPTDYFLYHYVLFLLSSDQFIALASKTVREGSKMPRIDWRFLLKSQFTCPSSAILKSFNDVVAPICGQLRQLALHNRRLIKARDSLMPHLVGGRLAIRE